MLEDQLLQPGATGRVCGSRAGRLRIVACSLALHAWQVTGAPSALAAPTAATPVAAQQPSAVSAVAGRPSASRAIALCEGRIAPIVPGVLVLRRAVGSASRDNSGCVANGLVVSGTAGTLLVDPGPHRLAGERLAAALARWNAPPVRWIVFTQARPERVLAASAWTSTAGVRLLASGSTARHMREHCGPCVERFAASVGPEALRDTSVPMGVEAVQEPIDIDLGGRRVTLRPLPFDAPDDGLVVLVPSARLVFVGGLAGAGVLAELRGSPPARIAALARLADERPSRVLGSEGPVGGPAVLHDALRYAGALQALVEADVNAGGDAATAGTRLVLPAFAKEALYAERHPLNVDALVRRLESTGSADAAAEPQARDASLR